KRLQRVERVQQQLKIKRPSLVNRKGVLYLHDNARPHVATATQKIISGLKWELIPHPPYSPDLAPTDFHLFRALQNNSNGKNFKTFEDVKSAIDSFFSDKSQDFDKRGIVQLPQRWEYSLR
ncbi:Histone-lysine N-methyltransferase SETMAR, partial [Habropoda laboriosa]